MSITITVPNDDHLALRAMGKALEEIAVARGATPEKTFDDIGPVFSSHKHVFMQHLSEATGVPEHMLRGEPDTTSQQVESLVKKEWPKEQCPVTGAVHDVDPADMPHSSLVEHGIDSNGTPWDERIHSASKALNSDGTWRLRRKPADKTPEEWTAYIKWVEEDVHTVLHGRSDEMGQVVEDVCVDEGCDHHGTPHVCITPEPPVTPAGDDFHVDAGEVTEQQIAAIPVPPLPPVANIQVGSPLPPAETIYVNKQPDGTLKPVEPAMTFPQVMQFLTERHGRITSAQVDDIIADMGLNSIMDLNTQPEHTGPFIARVKAHLGE